MTGCFPWTERRRLSSYQPWRTLGSLECVAFGFRHDLIVAAFLGVLITALVTFGSGNGFMIEVI